MPSTFLGIEIGQRGLATSQYGQDVTGNNIANAATPGYSDQQVNLVETDPWTVPDLNSKLTNPMLGTGVAAGSVIRARDQFLDVQVRDGRSAQNAQTGRRDVLKQVEQAFGEPSDQAVGSAMGTFYQGFNALANNPEDMGLRSTAIQNGQALVSLFQSTQRRLDVVGQQLDAKVGVDMTSVNSYGQQIAALNKTIRQTTALTQSANSLLDQRDLLIDKLSSLANISVINRSDGTVDIAIGNSDLVQGVDANTLDYNTLNAKGDLTSGELTGLTQAKTDLQGYQTDLDNLAARVASETNAQHKAGAGLDGTTGLAFFTNVNDGTENNITARTISVNPAVTPIKVAAAAAPTPPATTPPPGDAANAVALAGLETKPLSGGTGAGAALDGSTLTTYYQSFITDAASRTAAVSTAADSATVNAQQLSQQRDSVTGVSTDSEMVSMMKYQRAYEASARVVKTMDDMVGTLINNLFSN